MKRFFLFFFFLFFFPFAKKNTSTRVRALQSTDTIEKHHLSKVYTRVADCHGGVTGSFGDAYTVVSRQSSSELPSAVETIFYRSTHLVYASVRIAP